MNTKMLIAAACGGLVLFLTGGLVYALLLADYFAVEGVTRETANLLYIVPGELVFGCLLAWVLSCCGASSVVDGAKYGALVGFLIALGYGLIMYGATTITDLTHYLVEAVVWAVRFACAGAVIGWWYGRGATANGE
jgi:hypothetical protein